MNHSFVAAAETEYLEAVQFFEDKRTGLGAMLIDDFERAINLAVERPDAWRLVHPAGIRRIVLARFPFTAFLSRLAARADSGHRFCSPPPASRVLDVPC